MTFGEPIDIALYPYAHRGPLAYARSGQAAIVPVGRSREDVMFPVHPGWYDYRPAMVDLLQDEGLPAADEIMHGERANEQTANKPHHPSAPTYSCVMLAPDVYGLRHVRCDRDSDPDYADRLKHSVFLQSGYAWLAFPQSSVVHSRSEQHPDEGTKTACAINVTDFTKLPR